MFAVFHPHTSLRSHVIWGYESLRCLPAFLHSLWVEMFPDPFFLLHPSAQESSGFHTTISRAGGQEQIIRWLSRSKVWGLQGVTCVDLQARVVCVT